MQQAAILLAYLFFCVTSFSQTQPFTPGYNFKHVNVQNGLVYNIVYHFLQDSYGYMWIGTHNGLTLYDGIRTTNFLRNEEEKTSIAGTFITSILEDSAQQIWIGNENGIDLYNRTENCFWHFGVDRPDGTKDNSYCVLLGFVSPNELWFLDTKTRSIRSLNTTTKKASFINELNSVHAFLYKGSGQTVHIWSVYDKGTIHQVYNNSKLLSQQVYFDGKNAPFKNLQLEIIHALQQNDTTVWLSSNKGLVRLNPVGNTYIVFDQFQKQDVKELRYAALSPKGQLWAGSGPSGVYVFDIKTSQFIENLKNNKLDPFSICSDNIVSLYFDHTGNVWCGSYGNGSSYAKTQNIFFNNHLSKTEMQAWNNNNSLSWFNIDADKNAWCLFTDGGGFWMLDKELKMKKHIDPVLPNGSRFDGYIFKLLFDTKDEMWIATNKGIYRYYLRKNLMTPVKYELVSEEVQGSAWIRDIIRLRDSSVLFSTFAGLYRIRKEADQHIIKPINFLNQGAFDGLGQLFQDNAGLVYVKSLGDSLYILKPGNNGNYELINSMRCIPKINHYYNEPGDSLIYLAASNGLYHVNSNNFQITKDDLNNKLPFSNISSVFKKDGKLWVFGEKGLYFFDERNKQGRRYTIEDGLPANEFAPAVFSYTEDGRCVAGSSNGLISFFPDKKQDSIYPPRPRINNIYINDVLYTGNKNANETKKISLTFRQNTFSFDFAPIAFTHTSECSFEFKLEGYDENWVKSGVAQYTRYSKIPPGKYLFMLRVLDNEGTISPYDKLLEIEIAKSFWQTNFFKVILVAFALLSGRLFLKWYSNEKIKKQMRELEKLKAIEKERTRIATDMHDDLGAGLSRIKFLSETIGIKKQQQQPFEDDIVKIREYSHEMIDKMGEIVWALNEKNDSLSDLLSYIRVYTVGYLSQHGINCKMEMPDNFSTRFVSGEFRRNIYLTIKEALHNVVKHAQASSVKIIVKINEKLEISIADNGIGFDKHNIRPFSNGLTNMENRIKEIHGGFVILNEKGTVVKITVPLEV